MLGTTVALVVISSSDEVSSSFEDHLKSTVIGKLWSFKSNLINFANV